MGLEPRVPDEDMQALEVTVIGDEGSEAASGWLWAAIFALTLAADYVAFRFLLDRDYFHWYIANGAKLALVLTVFALAVKLDDEPGLVSAHPAQYAGAWFAFFGQAFPWLPALIGTDPSDTGSVPFWDTLVTILFALAWTVVACAWLVVVVPALYCVTLVCGAPVRMTLSRGRLAKIKSTPSKPRSKLWIPVVGRTVDVASNVREKPVTAAAAISAAALFALGFAV
jgi:hypothetical protein